jgi:hypothetical protein
MIILAIICFVNEYAAEQLKNLSLLSIPIDADPMNAKTLENPSGSAIWELADRGLLPK